MSTLSLYLAELFPALERFWRKPFLGTLRSSPQLQNIANETCHITLLSSCPSYNIAALSFLTTLLSYSQPFKLCRHLACRIILLSFSCPWNFAGVYRALLQCWDFPDKKTLLKFILSYYIAELFPILDFCWCIQHLFTLLKCSQSWSIAVVYPALEQCWATPNHKTLLLCTFSYFMAKMFPIRKLSWFVPCLITFLRYCQFYYVADNTLSYYNAELFTML